MPSRQIVNYLQTDVLDTTASSVQAANPTLFPTASSVPVYLYNSLKTIWDPEGNLSDFQKRIISDLGKYQQKATGYINVIPMELESVLGDSFLSDYTGAETSEVFIFFTLTRPIPQMDYYKIRNAELRIRMLLDFNLRSLAGKTPDIPIINSVDPSIDNTQFTPGFLRCVWKRFTSTPDSSELVSLYRTDYLREFGQTIINIP